MSQLSGEHGLRTYAAVVYGLATGRRSGRLEVRAGDHVRRLYFVAGRPVRYTSSLTEDELEHSLVESGLASRKQVNWIRQHLGAGDDLGRELVSAGLLEAESLAEHARWRLERGVTAPLHWIDGTWFFDPLDHLAPDHIDPALLGDIGVPALLWASLQQVLTMDEALPEVTAQGAGALVVRPDLLEHFDDFAVRSPLDELPGAIGAGVSVEELFRAIPDRTGGLVKLLWLLEGLGLLGRESRDEPETVALARALASWEPLGSPVRPPPLPEPGPAPTPEILSELDPAETSGRSESGRLRAPLDPVRLADLVRTEHERRMGRDYYAFAGVKPKASTADITRACARLARRYGKLRKLTLLPPEVRGLAGELAAGATLVARTLGDESRRAEYDRRRAMGKAPRLEAIRAATDDHLQRASAPEQPVPLGVASDADPLAVARALMDEGDWGRAASNLERLRRERPSDPDVLADLGLALYRASGRRRADEADELLRLALTFDGNHLRAAEALARIAVDGGDVDVARRRLRKLLSLQADHPWAQRRLAELEDEASEDRSRGRGFRFWRKEE